MGDYFSSNQEILSEILKHYRKEKGYTQLQVAEHLGLDRSTYTKYETARKPELDIIIQLSAFYGVSIEEFLGEYPSKVVKEYSVNTTVTAAAPEPGDGTKLTRDEERLLALYRKSIRKSEIMSFVCRITDEDGEITKDLTE